jgi:hypothetical protein
MGPIHNHMELSMRLAHQQGAATALSRRDFVKFAATGTGVALLAAL